MKKKLFYLFWGIVASCCASLPISAQKTVKSLKIDQIGMTFQEALFEWPVDSLSQTQLETLLSTGEIQVLVQPENHTTEQLGVILETHPTITRPSDYNTISHRGLHLDIEVGYSPFGMWESITNQANGTISEKLKSQYTIGLNTALVYNFGKDFYVGGGTGMRMVELSWRTESDLQVTSSFALPLYLRAGFCSSFSSSFSLFLNVDAGIMMGLTKQKTTGYGDAQVGIYYGTTKIAIGTMCTKPDTKYFMGENLSNLYDGGICLILGFSI